MKQLGEMIRGFGLTVFCDDRWITIISTVRMLSSVWKRWGYLGRLLMNVNFYMVFNLKFFRPYMIIMFYAVV